MWNISIYFDAMITKGARCTPDIKYRTDMEKAAINKNKAPLTSKLDLNLKKRLV
jgi:hypothetical protein